MADLNALPTRRGARHRKWATRRPLLTLTHHDALLALFVGLAAALALGGGCASTTDQRADRRKPTPCTAPTQLRLASRPAQRSSPPTVLALRVAARGRRRCPTASSKSRAAPRLLVTPSVGGLLDEADLISGVSAAASLALSDAWTAKVVRRDENRFLERDVQGALIARTLPSARPAEAVGGLNGRSETRRGLLRRNLFEGATFGSLLDKPTPMVAVTGTDISTGAPG